MPKASQKTIQAIYGIISNEIVYARMDIAEAIRNKDYDKVDEILFRLNKQAPMRAIGYFNNDKDESHQSKDGI